MPQVTLKVCPVDGDPFDEVDVQTREGEGGQEVTITGRRFSGGARLEECSITRRIADIVAALDHTISVDEQVIVDEDADVCVAVAAVEDGDAPLHPDGGTTVRLGEISFSLGD